jgi:flagellar basal-body rod modification protein FlgD
MDPITSSSTTTRTTSGAPVNPASVIGKDEFLKILVGQLKHQNPMNPSSGEDFIGQMAQFSTVEQVGNMAKGNEEMLKMLRSDQAFGMIGKTVSYISPDGLTEGRWRRCRSSTVRPRSRSAARAASIR